MSGSYMSVHIETREQVRAWKELLDGLLESPPYSPEGKAGWHAGYETALWDLARARAAGARI